ncbi:DUF92 domain-containing protein [archaeon]|nr:DUF92 domain-containing protein [archaeon]
MTELLILGLTIPFAIGAIAYYTKALDAKSSLVGAIMGYMIILTQGFEWFIAFIAFFALGSIATKYRYKEKTEYGVSQKQRKIENVLGNGLVAVLLAFFGSAYSFTPLAIYGFFAAIATATADTLSSEIGILSTNTPVSVLDFKTEVKRGTNGGITNRGNMLMFIGSGSIAAIALMFFNNWPLFWITLWGGIIGCTSDSILGATIENKGIVGNSTVNFLATLSGSIFAIGLYQLFLSGF